MRRPSMTGTMRWVLTALTVALLVVWPLTRLWSVIAVFSVGKGIGVDAGVLALWAEQPLPFPGADYSPGVYVRKSAVGRLQGMQWWFRCYKDPRKEFLQIPLWCLAFPLGAATALAWRSRVAAAMRPALGACACCGCSRTGLAPDAPCPECGKAPAA